MAYRKGYASYKGHPHTEPSNVRVLNQVDTNLVSYNDDAFGRLRISSPYSLFDYTSVFGKEPMLFDEGISGNATSTHNEGSYILMNVSTENGARVIRQSRQYIPYQPGKSKLYYLTGVLTNSLTANITSRIGSFDESNGNFFEYSNGTISIVERNGSTNIRVARSNWIDPLNGKGKSGISVDFTKAQIFYFDQEWLGVGRVRGGVIVNGKYYQCVNFSHSGASAVSQPYYRLAKLPIRYEIQGHGESGNMRMICGSVMSEGGYNNLGTTFSSKPFTLKSFTTTDGLLPIMSLRLRDISGTIPHLYATLKIKGFDILNTDKSKVMGWKLLWNPTLTLVNGSFANYDTTYSSAQICHHGTSDTVSGGIVLASGLAEQGANFVVNVTPDEIISSIGVCRNIAGTSDVITLAGQAVSGNTSAYTTLSWIEIR